MAVTVEQLWDNPRLADDSGELRYRVSGTTDIGVARAAAVAVAPTIILSGGGYLTRQSTEGVQTEDTEDEFDVSVRYALRDRKEKATGESTFSFETGGGTRKVQNSIQTMGCWIPSGPAVSQLGGAIGWDGEKVEGVDITSPQFTFSETHYLAAGVVTWAYIRNLMLLTGSFNQSAWRVFAPGECLFLGASGQRRGNDDWEITFKFSAMPNVAGVTIGSITGICARGWDYLWVKYVETPNSTETKLIPEVAEVYVEQVYNAANFLLLGIGP